MIRARNLGGNRAAPPGRGGLAGRNIQTPRLQEVADRAALDQEYNPEVSITSPTGGSASASTHQVEHGIRDNEPRRCIDWLRTELLTFEDMYKHRDDDPDFLKHIRKLGLMARARKCISALYFLLGKTGSNIMRDEAEFLSESEWEKMEAALAMMLEYRNKLELEIMDMDVEVDELLGNWKLTWYDVGRGAFVGSSK